MAERAAAGKPPSGRRVPRESVRIEARALRTAAGSLVIAVVTGMFVFASIRPGLSGADSVGDLSATVSGILAAAVFTVAYRLSSPLLTRPWLLEIGWPQRLLDVAALAFAHAAICYMVCLAVFRIFQSAFIGLTLDAPSGSLMVGLAVAICSYFVFLSGSRINSYSVSTVLTAFAASGLLTSMVTAADPNWWRVNFSVLGASDSSSASTFNMTLIISGVVITTMAGFMLRDLQVWTKRDGGRPAKVSPIHLALVLLGLLLACVGLIPVDAFLFLHNLAAIGLTLVFGVLVIGLRFWVPELSRTFFVASYGILAAVAVAMALFYPLGYYNLTGMELTALGLILGWLVVLIRNIAAAAEDRA